MCRDCGVQRSHGSERAERTAASASAADKSSRFGSWGVGDWELKTLPQLLLQFLPVPATESEARPVSQDHDVLAVEPGLQLLDALGVHDARAVDTDEAAAIEAAGNYVRLHLGEESHLFRETMNGMEGRLDPRRFVRIHRSRIVNTERIKELQPWFNGDYVVILRDGTRLTLSRGYREKLQDRIGKGF